MADIQSGRQTLVARILEGEGQAALPLRRAAFHAAQLDEPLKSLVSKVAEHAADIGDDDLARVRDSGLTEDQVFELVVCAAVGQATRQYERAIGALRAATAKE